MPYEARYKKDPSPDPLDGLSGYERMKLLTMRPTWSERLRLCNPELSREEKRDLMIDVLYERREAYDRWFHARCQTIALQRAENRYATNEFQQTDFTAYASSAFTPAYRQYVHHRREHDLIDQTSKQQYQQRRAQHHASQAAPRRKRSRSR